MVVDENFIHRMTLRFVGAINKAREEKIQDLGDFFKILKQHYSQKSPEITDFLEKIEGKVLDKLAQIVNSITVKAIGHLGFLREEIIQKGMAVDQIEEKPTKVEAPPSIQSGTMDRRKIETASKIKREISRRNRILKELLETVPQFKILAIIEKTKANNYTTISKATGYSNTAVRNYIHELEEDGFIRVDRARKPFIFTIENTPW
ncbi:winged helix-turn-helix transcriptional regulator [Candidatus Borrarchaeum sp.]|uniref:winged helix-turn-helix transcriptional regulator n=1 Tax=Candidatus Borrarchaeum sp. TaxID=2846742 RepID=UPI00257A6104|nr:winged helix-turn-helix transcriptional regulator [Candidatus Borrarchaeum sp.]